MRAHARSCLCPHMLMHLCPSSFCFHSQADQPSLMPGKGKSEEAGQVVCMAVVLLALLLPSPSLLACPLPPVTRCSLHKATILEQAGIKWKWKISRYDPPSLSCVSHPPLSRLFSFTHTVPSRSPCSKAQFITADVFVNCEYHTSWL